MDGGLRVLGFRWDEGRNFKGVELQSLAHAPRMRYWQVTTTHELGIRRFVNTV